MNKFFLLLVIISQFSLGQILESSILNHNDDSEEYENNSEIIINNSTLRIGGYSSNLLISSYKIKVGLFFDKINIPSDAEIIDAYIEFTVCTTSNNTSKIKIRSELNRKYNYTTTTGDILNRKYSNLEVEWNTTPFNKFGMKVRTPNLKNIIDENRLSGWIPSQGLAFKLDGNNYIGAVYSRNGSTTLQPKLVINYKNNGKGPIITDIISDPKLIDNLLINEIASEGTVSQKEDWIEIYNNNEIPIFISNGIFISNDIKKLKLAELKNIFIPAKGFKTLIFDEMPELGNDHLGFKLKSKSKIILSKEINDKMIELDNISYPEMGFNQSYGRITDANPQFSSFIKDSYQSSNKLCLEKINTVISHERGLYNTGFDVTISAPEGYKIKYTLDGRTPSGASGIDYLGNPIKINKTTVLKYFAYNLTGNSGVQTHSYILKDNLKNEVFRPVKGGNEWNFKRNNYYAKITSDEYAKALELAPIFSVASDIDVNARFDGLYIPSTFEYLDSHINSGAKNYFNYIGFKKQGNWSSINQYNSGMKAKFHADFGSKKAEYNFFTQFHNDQFPTVKKFSSLKFKEGEDGPQMNIWGVGFNRFDEKMIQDLCKKMGKFAPNTKYVQYFMNGHYTGLKTMMEDWGNNMFEEYFGSDDNFYTEITFKALGNGNNDAINYHNGIVETGAGKPELWNEIKRYAGYANINNDIYANSTNFQKLKEKVDIDDLIKYQLIYMFTDTEIEARGVVHNDAPLFSKLKFNINDTDGAFFGANSGGIIYTGGTTIRKWNNIGGNSLDGPGGLFRFLVNDSRYANLEFKTLIKDQVLKQIGWSRGDFKGNQNAPLSVKSVNDLILANVKELDILYKVDAAYMQFTYDVYSRWKNTEVPRILRETESRVKLNLEKWLSNGLAHTLDYVIIDSNEIENTTNITLTSPNNNTKIYYTLNGNDPMGNDGIISSDAILYNGKFTLSVGNYTLVTRAFTPNNWGPISYKPIQIQNKVGKLIISGINYNPKSNNNAEFLLLTNSGNTTLDLSNYSISDAFVYTFPKGVLLGTNETLMLAKDLTLISDFNSLQKFQWTSGSLSNSGEIISFKDNSNKVINSVVYGITNPWNPYANGNGYYLKLKDNTLDNTLGENWDAIPLNNTSSLNQEISKIAYFPNPVTTELNINLLEDSNAVINIYNILGNLEITKSLKQSNNIINVSYLQFGTYTVNVLLPNGKIETFKIVKN